MTAAHRISGGSRRRRRRPGFAVRAGAVGLIGVLLVACSSQGGTASRAGASAATERRTPTADASINAAAPRARHGRSRRLRVDGAPIARAYVRFDARHVTGRLKRATLRLYAITGSKAGFRVHGVARRAWRESRLTYANAPRVARRIAARSGPVRARTWTRVDVTSLVRRPERRTFALTTRSRRALRFASRESRRKPVLELVTAGPVPPPGPAPPADVVVTAAGDYASSGTDPESIAAMSQVIAAKPQLHLGLGDYNYGDIDTILTGFDRIWGPKPAGLFAKFRPTAGPTHDVTSCTDARYEDYWGRPAMKGYGFDLGAWHIVSLPSAAYRYDCDTDGVLAWLKNDLAASTARCTLAFWHEPYWTNPTPTHARTTAVKPWVQALYDADAELILSGHQHDYQRFAPQDPNDHIDRARGLREFVVGTGGVSHYPFSGTAPNIEAQNDNTWGALKLTLKATGYDWRFLPAAGGAFTDSGAGTCH
jgi:hypothetical protein